MENPVERAVNEATADTLQMPDQKLMKNVADLVNQRADQSKLAVLAIGKRLMQLRNGKVQALSMELIEYLAYTCETPFYTQIATNDFLQRLNTLLNPQMNPQMQSRLLQVISILRSLMQQHQDLFPAFFQFLQKIQSKHTIPNNYESKYSVLRKAPVYTSSSAARTNSLGPENSKNAKLKRDLEIVKSNIQLTNEIIDNANPVDDAGKNEILRDMTTTLRGVEEKLRNLITDMGNNDEGLMSFCLELNDDLLKTFDRYETLKKHKKPAPFKPEQVPPPQPQTQPQQPAQQQQAPFPQAPQPFVGLPPAPQQVPAPVPPPKPQQIDLLNLFEYDEPKPAAQKPQPASVQPPKQSNITDLFDIDLPTDTQQQQQQQQVPQQQQQQIPITQFQQQQPPVQFPPQQQFQQPQIPNIQPQSFVQQPQQQFPQQFQQQQQQFQQPQFYGQQPQQQSNYSVLNAFPPQQPQQFNQQNLSQLYQQQPQQLPQQSNLYQAFQQPQTISQAFPAQPMQGYPPQYGNMPSSYPVNNVQQTSQKKPENEFDDILNLAVSKKPTQPQQPQQQQKLDLF